MSEALAQVHVIVVAGGAGSRLGGVSKPELELGGVSLLDRALQAVEGAHRVVIVGGPRRDGVLWTVEDPPGGGPAAAVAAGLRALEAEGRADWTLVLGVDTPLAAQAVPLLMAARDRDGAWLVDADGREQPLVAVYRTSALAQHAQGDLAGAPMRRLVGELDMCPVVDPAGLARDVDTWADVEHWRALHPEPEA